MVQKVGAKQKTEKVKKHTKGNGQKNAAYNMETGSLHCGLGNRPRLNQGDDQ